MAEVETQVAYILEAMVSCAVSEVAKVVDGDSKEGSEATAETEPMNQKVFQLSLVMAALAQDAVEKLCQLFHESKVTEVEELRRKLEAAESDLRLARDSHEGPLTSRPAALQSGQTLGGQRRNVVVICDTALKRMPFFRIWSKSGKNRIRKVTVQDRHVHQQEEDEEEEGDPDRNRVTEEGPDMNTEKEEGPREPSKEPQNEVNQNQDDPQTHESANDVVHVVIGDVPEEAGAEVEPEEETEDKQSEAAVEPVDAHLDFINKQTAFISKLVNKVRTASEDNTVTTRKVRKPLNPAEAVRCSVCDKLFPKQKLLDLHMLMHTGERPHLCDICGKSFMLRGSLLSHQRKHSNVRSFTCDTCGKSFFLKTQLNRHKTVHTQHKPYKCQHCGKAFRNTGNLKRHVFIHTGEKPYTCDYCGKAFIQNVTLQAHRLTHTGVKPYKCHCGKAYTQRNTLMQHQLIHDTEEAWENPVACVACESVVPRESMPEHLEIHTPPLSCIRCSRALLTPAELRSHQKEHTGKKPHGCHICSKSFQSASYLKIHIQSHDKDGDDKPFHCTICGRNFAHQTTLNYHQAVHSGQKPYACQTCGKTFSNPGNVSRHQLIHTGAKPYTCQQCGRGFNQSCSLKAHLRTHTGHKPYMCDNCGRSFADKRNLKEHKCRA